MPQTWFLTMTFKVELREYMVSWIPLSITMFGHMKVNKSPTLEVVSVTICDVHWSFVVFIICTASIISILERSWEDCCLFIWLVAGFTWNLWSLVRSCNNIKGLDLHENFKSIFVHFRQWLAYAGKILQSKDSDILVICNLIIIDNFKK